MALDQISYHGLDNDTDPITDDKLFCMAHDGETEARKEVLGDLAPFALQRNPPLDMKFPELRVNNITATPSGIIPAKYSNMVNNVPSGDLSPQHTPNLPNQYWGTAALINGAVYYVKDDSMDLVWDTIPNDKLWTDNFFRIDSPNYPEYAPVVAHQFPGQQHATLAFRIKHGQPYNSVYHLYACWRLRIGMQPIFPEVYPYWVTVGYFNTQAHATIPTLVNSIVSWCIIFDRIDGYTVSMSTIFRVTSGAAEDIYIAPVIKNHYVWAFWAYWGRMSYQLLEYRTTLFRIA